MKPFSKVLEWEECLMFGTVEEATKESTQLVAGDFNISIRF